MSEERWDRCPMCNQRIEFEPDDEDGSIIDCPSCGASLSLVGGEDGLFLAESGEEVKS